MAKLAEGIAKFIDPPVWGETAHRVPIGAKATEHRKRASMKKANAILQYLSEEGFKVLGN